VSGSQRTEKGWVGTGEFAHEWAFLLLAELAARDEPLAVVFDVEPPEYARKLLDTLGVEIVVSAPAMSATEGTAV
jgi:hypothetical protein